MKNKKFIFDLDYTLYSPITYPEDVYYSNYDKFYEDLKSDADLGKLLKITKHNYIFTNAGKEHMELCLKKMRIKSHFKNTIYNDLYNYKYKPDPLVYKLAIDKFKLKQDDTIFFFEDLAENLKTAKALGWKTVFLDHHNKMKKKPKYIDYKFDNIYDAIKFVQKL